MMEIKYEACSDWAVLKIKVYAKHRAILFVQVSSRVVNGTSRNSKVLIDSYLSIVKALVGAFNKEKGVVGAFSSQALWNFAKSR